MHIIPHKCSSKNTGRRLCEEGDGRTEEGDMRGEEDEAAKEVEEVGCWVCLFLYLK